MIVQIGGGIRAQGEEFFDFRTVIDAVHKEGCSIARNWMEHSNYNTKNAIAKDEEMDWAYAVRENEYAVARADLYIAETTTYRLYHGYELSLALQKGIPVLLVSRKSFRQYAISGVKNKLLTMKTYKDRKELAEIVREFIAANQMASEDLTVQTPIDRVLLTYLDDMASAAGKTKGEALYELAKLGMQVQKITAEKKM